MDTQSGLGRLLDTERYPIWGNANGVGVARHPCGVLLFWVVLAVQTGHLLSPMALAWGHDRFRALMLQCRVKFIVTPLAILALATVAGWIGGRSLPPLRLDPVTFKLAAGARSLSDLRNPFLAMGLLYAIWNAYHFGMQAFGVMSIYRRKKGGYAPRQRRLDMAYCCCAVWATMLIPFIPRLTHGVHDLAGWPATPHSFLDRVQPTYLALALALIILMLWREWRVGQSLPRTLFILTDGFGMTAASAYGASRSSR